LLALWQGDVATARTLQEQALHCFQSIGHQAGEGFTLTCLGHGAQAFHNYTEAWHYYDQALHVSRAIGDRFGESLALACIGYVPFHQGNYDGAWNYFQQALQLHCEIGDRRGESDMLAILGLLAHLLEDNANARALCEQALHIAQELGNQPFQSRALTFLGHALVGLDRLDEAVHAYEQAVTLRNALNQAFLAMEPRAGLARIALRQEDLVQAEAHVAAILDYLDTGKLDGVFEPLRIYLTCYDVLRALNDPRAEGLLVTAYRLLHEWRDALRDPVAQRWLLENVAVHRTIVAEYAQVMHDADVLVQRGA
jgi:tetratricopeptide (TPR) repeat protein